jgi:[ribosomal protein S5]-alanine N-acetyltransferase
MIRIAETARLIIRNWELSDAEALCILSRAAGFSDFSVSGYKDFSHEQAKEWIQFEIDRYQKERLGKFAVVVKRNGNVIGVSGIFRDRNLGDQIEINYRFPETYQGFGYATEAARAILNYGFETLDHKEIYANVEISNTASHKVLARLGMEKIGNFEYAGRPAEKWRLLRSNFKA